ncbi:kinase-like domain-containing protein, partial [Massariosphaeria phaeospora]
IKKKFSRKDVMSGMALREISALDQLDHANINKLVAYDIDMANQVGAAFLELCDLGNLADLIKRHRKAKRPIPEGFVWHVFIALVDALRYMQKGPFGMTDVALWNEIYHRDISPENVFLATASSEDAYPRVVLGDFGCSASRIDVECRLTSGRRVERQNPEFEPPEAPFYNSQSDIYTVALMVVCMCRLKPDRWPIPERVDEQWVLGQGYSAELNALVRRCLQGRLASRIGIQDLWNMTNASRL